MKVRVISSVVGVALLAVVVFLSINFPIVWNIAVAVMASIAIYEILKGTKAVNSGIVCILSVIFAIIIQFADRLDNYILIAAFALFAYIVALFLICMSGKITVPEISFSFMGTVMVSVMFLSLVMIKGKFGFPGVIMCVCTAWLTDIFALFSGMLFGKHKLAPVISPKKTVEGAVGGCVCCVALCAIIANVYAMLSGNGIKVNNLSLVIVVLVCSVISMIGDLSFSLIKRHFKIKDYGNIMPGHGGVLDRFDSVLFAAPTFLLLSYVLPVIK